MVFAKFFLLYVVLVQSLDKNFISYFFAEAIYPLLFYDALESNKYVDQIW